MSNAFRDYVISQSPNFYSDLAADGNNAKSSYPAIAGTGSLIYHGTLTDRAGSNHAFDDVNTKSTILGVDNYISSSGSAFAAGDYIQLTFNYKSEDDVNGLIPLIGGNRLLVSINNGMLATAEDGYQNVDMTTMATNRATLLEGINTVAVEFIGSYKTSLRLYLNGELVRSTTLANGVSTMWIGKDYANNYAGSITPIEVSNLIQWTEAPSEVVMKTMAYLARYNAPPVDFTGVISSPYELNSWFVDFHLFSTGELYERITSASGSFTKTLPDVAYIVTVTGDTGSAWRDNFPYEVGDLVMPTDPANTMYYFKCVTAGVTGTSEPNWNTSAGGHTGDNTASWEMVETLPQPVAVGPVRGREVIVTL